MESEVEDKTRKETTESSSEEEESQPTLPADNNGYESSLSEEDQSQKSKPKAKKDKPTQPEISKLASTEAPSESYEGNDETHQNSNTEEQPQTSTSTNHKSTVSSHRHTDHGDYQQKNHIIKQKRIELDAEFCSFLELRDAIERYQREKSVQLIVKDSKLLKAKSTMKVIPKTYHLVNQSLLYHSLTYCCKCHGELKQKPGTRIKNVGAKRLNCPMYFRLRLTPDYQRLVVFDIYEIHNHAIDPNTSQMTPRQQVYTLSLMRKEMTRPDYPEPPDDVAKLIASAIKDVSSVSETSYEPSPKKAKTEPANDSNNQEIDDAGDAHINTQRESDDPDSPLDSDSSFSDSDSDEETKIQRRLLPFPVRLIGSAAQSSPELIQACRQLIELQKSKLELEREKLLLQTKNLELSNAKLELEVRKMERTLAAEAAEHEHQSSRDTTIYLQAS